MLTNLLFTFKHNQPSLTNLIRFIRFHSSLWIRSLSTTADPLIWQSNSLLMVIWVRSAFLKPKTSPFSNIFIAKVVTNWSVDQLVTCQLVTTYLVGRLWKGEVLGPKNAKHTNNLFGESVRVHRWTVKIDALQGQFRVHRMDGIHGISYCNKSQLLYDNPFRGPRRFLQSTDHNPSPVSSKLLLDKLLVCLSLLESKTLPFNNPHIR